jgi:hypothetical protein
MLRQFLTGGLKVGSTSRRSSFAQLMPWKKACFLMAAAPSGPEPRRLAGSRLRRPFMRFRAALDRNSARQKKGSRGSAVWGRCVRCKVGRAVLGSVGVWRSAQCSMRLGMKQPGPGSGQLLTVCSRVLRNKGTQDTMPCVVPALETDTSAGRAGRQRATFRKRSAHARGVPVCVERLHATSSARRAATRASGETSAGSMPIQRVGRALGYLGLAATIWFCSWLRLLARKGGMPHSISYSRILGAARERVVSCRRMFLGACCGCVKDIATSRGRQLLARHLGTTNTLCGCTCRRTVEKAYTRDDANTHALLSGC